MKKRINYRNRGKIITSIVLAVLLFILLIPLWWAITLSFDGNSITSLPDFAWWPKNFSLKSYKYAFDRIELLRYYRNTIFVTVVNTGISVFFAMVAGYAFAKGRFWGKKFWYFYMLAVMMIPFETRMIPLYLQYSDWGMIDTYWPLILGHFAYVYGIFFARTNIAALPDSLREAGKIDGMGEWGCFFKIILPLSKPVLATLTILQVIAQWNNYLWPLIVIRSSEKHMISVGVSLFNASETARLYGPRFAVAVLSAVPLVIVFLFLQKYIVESVAVSGIKQ